jgi:hypothetical protein
MLTYFVYAPLLKRNDALLSSLIWDLETTSSIGHGKRKTNTIRGFETTSVIDTRWNLFLVHP